MVLPRKWFIDRFPMQTKTCFSANVSLAKGLTPRLSSSVPRRAGTLRVPQRCSWPWRMDTEKFRASCGRAWFEWRCEQNMEWIYHHLEKTSFYWDNYIKLGIFSKPLWIGGWQSPLLKKKPCFDHGTCDESESETVSAIRWFEQCLKFFVFNCEDWTYARWLNGASNWTI